MAFDSFILQILVACLLGAMLWPAGSLPPSPPGVGYGAPRSGAFGAELG